MLSYKDFFTVMKNLKREKIKRKKKIEEKIKELVRECRRVCENLRAPEYEPWQLRGKTKWKDFPHLGGITYTGNRKWGQHKKSQRVFWQTSRRIAAGGLYLYDPQFFQIHHDFPFISSRIRKKIRKTKKKNLTILQELLFHFHFFLWDVKELIKKNSLMNVDWKNLL